MLSLRVFSVFFFGILGILILPFVYASCTESVNIRGEVCTAGGRCFFFSEGVKDASGSLDALSQESEGSERQGCEPGEEGSCYNGPQKTGGVGSCRFGKKTCGENRIWGACEGEVLPNVEFCGDGKDNNCDGIVDGKECSTKSICVSWKPWKVLVGHKDRVTSVAFSPDGRLLASGSYGNERKIKLWNVDSGKVIYEFGDDLSFKSVAFSPDGKLLVGAGYSKVIKVWKISERKLIYRLSGHQAEIQTVSFSPDGKLLASSSWDKTIKLWDISNGKLRYNLLGHSSVVFGLAFSPNGKLLASSSYDKTIKLWNLSNGQVVRTLLGHRNDVYEVVFHPNGSVLVSSSLDDTIKFWRISDGSVIRTIPDIWPVTVVFNSDGSLLISGSSDSSPRIPNDLTIKVREFVNGKLLRVFSFHKGAVRQLVFNVKRNLFASASHDRRIVLWSCGG